MLCVVICFLFEVLLRASVKLSIYVLLLPSSTALVGKPRGQITALLNVVLKEIITTFTFFFYCTLDKKIEF